MKVSRFHIRASYPNYFMVNLYVNHGREIFNHNSEDPDNVLEGNKPGTVIYSLEGDEPGIVHEYPPRWYDMYCMMKLKGEAKRHFLELMLDEKAGNPSDELEQIRNNFYNTCKDFVEQNPLYDSEYLMTPLTTEGEFTDYNMSYKGRMLLDLTRNCYPVPDFCILTAKTLVDSNKLPVLLEKAISDLEIMTNCRLGDIHNPLVFAIRCAMPQYIPGLMPTLLNIGVTHEAYKALSRSFGDSMANRVYLSTLHTIAEMLGISKRYEHSDISLSPEAQVDRIENLERQICDIDKRLINDAHYQTLKLTMHVCDFYQNNSDLIITFMQGKQTYPSLILQRMVWTIGNNESYPGVLYSRHSRTGTGKQIESYRNIFGEEIMTGDVTTEDTSYMDRNEIRKQFPAVYHFDPLLKKMEARYKMPLTIEFAVETRPHELSLFSVLQLNASEMTGRASLVSSIDMRNEGLINDSHVMDLIKPYHLRQIVSASIDDKSLNKLQFFGHGLSVLPRTAISAQLCFTISKARELKTKGFNVCLCQKHFAPEDTITLNEIDAILSMMPAAIHVVTACRGYGIPAFLDLNSYGITMHDNMIMNEEGVTISEGEILTVSSRRQCIYKGEADFRPARFTKYLQGAQVQLSDDEKLFFEQMRLAYKQYQNIVTSQQALYITDINKLARLIRLDLHNQPQTAINIVKSWYEQHPKQYIDGVLQSRMGDHNDQSRLFNMLDSDHQVDFMHRIYATCQERHISGLTAGSFMIGRFVARPLKIKVWNCLSNAVVAFLLNEYVLYEKYQQVLQDVGEIKLARAHSRIETEGIDNMVLRNFDLGNFVTLLYSHRDWNIIASELEKMEHQDNTHLLIEMLSRPIEEIFEFDDSKPWKKAYVEELLKETEK